MPKIRDHRCSLIASRGPAAGNLLNTLFSTIHERPKDLESPSSQRVGGPIPPEWWFSARGWEFGGHALKNSRSPSYFAAGLSTTQAAWCNATFVGFPSSNSLMMFSFEGEMARAATHG